MSVQAPLLAMGGFCVGIVTSAAVFSERLTGGAPPTAVAGHVAITVAALALSSSLPARERRSRSYVAAACGASVGAALGHGVLAATRATPWMSEAPPQFVNDAVAVLATLALVLAFAGRKVALACVVAVTAVIGVYALTHSLWHVDREPHLVATVQRCVVAQFFSVLVALLVYREARSRLFFS